jgi:hypothetical protein
MAFPTSGLTNNLVHKEGNRAFVYDSALGAWDQVRETERTENKILSGTLGSGVTFPAGHIIKISSHVSTVDIVKSAAQGLEAEADANDLTVTCTAGNKLHIWIVGGFTYATSTTGYFQCGMVIEESGQSDVHSFGSYLYQRTASGNYNNDSHPSVMYTHTAITSSVTIKRGVHNPATAITSYWQAVNAYNSGARYLVMEEQV